MALDVADQSPESVRALILADAPIDKNWLVEWMGSKEILALCNTFRDLAGLGLPVSDLITQLAEAPVFVPGKDEAIKFGELPYADSIYLLHWAAILSPLDPGVLEYPA